MKRAIAVILFVLFADQGLKIWVKLHFTIGEFIPGDINSKYMLHFIENDGMAFGMKFGGENGKLLLTLLRIAAVIGIGYALRRMVRSGAGKWHVVSVALVFAGALGNIIDCTFYGLLFDKGSLWDPIAEHTISYSGLAQLDFSGYAPLFHGSVVDMLHLPLWRGTLPEWIPFVGGDYFEFFEPVFNIADTAITVGIALFILTQRKQRQKEIADGATDVPAVAVAADDAPPVASTDPA